MYPIMYISFVKYLIVTETCNLSVKFSLTTCFEKLVIFRWFLSVFLQISHPRVTIRRIVLLNYLFIKMYYIKLVLFSEYIFLNNISSTAGLALPSIIHQLLLDSFISIQVFHINKIFYMSEVCRVCIYIKLLFLFS